LAGARGAAPTQAAPTNPIHAHRDGRAHGRSWRTGGPRSGQNRRRRTAGDAADAA